MILALTLIGLCGSARATPYFRPIDFQHTKPVVGALLAPENLKKTSGGGLIPLITHSPKDGCLLPSIVCEDWTPLAVGVSMSAGNLTLDAAPLANVLPWMQRGLLTVVPASWQSVRSMLAPADGTGSTTFSAGPVWEYQQLTNKGYFRVFTGLALHF